MRPLLFSSMAVALMVSTRAGQNSIAPASNAFDSDRFTAEPVSGRERTTKEQAAGENRTSIEG